MLQRWLPSTDFGSYLKNFNLAASWTYEYATTRLWKVVTLVDQRTTNTEPERNVDDHDDTPIIRKLLLLATYAFSPPFMML